MRPQSLFLVALAMLVTATGVSAAGKGSSMLSVGLGQGTADLYQTNAILGTGSYLEPIQRPETNAGLEYWYLFSDDYAATVSAAYGMSNMKWETSSDPTDPEIKASSTGFKVRVGGDRIGKVGDRLLVFMGPGLEYWSGKQKVEVGGTEVDLGVGESVTRFGVSGRIGGFMMLSDNVGVMGQVGHTFGIASSEDGAAKSTWWPSSFNASWGLTLAFGGD